MKLFAPLSCAALLLATPFAFADDCALKGPTNITITRAEGGARAHYQLAEAVHCLRMGDRGDVRKLSWRLQTAGARLSEDGNTVQFTSPRRGFIVDVRAFERDGLIDRVYSPLIAFGDGSAVAVYTAYLKPAVIAGGVFMAFDGFAPTAPERHVGPQRIGNEQTYMVVGKPVLERRGAVAAAIDQAMPAWLLARVLSTIAQGEGALRRVTGATRPLAYLMTYTEPAATHATWRGDTLDMLVRLNFMGAPWQQSQPEMHDNIDQFILHELFHTASAHALDDKLPGAMSLLEGGAEAGAMAMRRRFAPAAGASMDRAIDDAIGRCQDIAGGTLAEKEQKSQHNAPYLCGLALQFMAGAAAGRDPLALWEVLLRKGGKSHAGWPSFLAGAAPGRSNPRAVAMLEDIALSRISWEEGLAKLAGAGVVRRLPEVELAGPSFAPSYRAGAIFHLLGQACSQRYGFSSRPPIYELDAPPGTCGAVPDKFRLVALNGLRLEVDAYKAYREVARRCRERLPVELTNDSGQNIELACNVPMKEIVRYSLSAPVE